MKRKPRPTEQKATEEEIMQALEETRGLVAPAAAKLGYCRQSLHRRISQSQALKDKHDEVREQTNDYVENKLFELIAKGVPSAVIFYMKCQAKNRGYVERIENTGKDGKDLNVLPVVSPPRATSMEEWLSQNKKEKEARAA